MSSVENSVKELEKFCGSAALGYDALREKIKLIPSDALLNSSVLHRACENKRVTLAIVQCLLDAFPGAARVRAKKISLAKGGVMCVVYPLHTSPARGQVQIPQLFVQPRWSALPCIIRCDNVRVSVFARDLFS